MRLKKNKEGKERREKKEGRDTTINLAQVKSMICLGINKHKHKYLDLAPSWSASLASVQIPWPYLDVNLGSDNDWLYNLGCLCLFSFIASQMRILKIDNIFITKKK